MDILYKELKDGARTLMPTLGYEISTPVRHTSHFLMIYLNVFDSGIEYTEMDWVRLKVRHYPRQISGFVQLSLLCCDCFPLCHLA